MIISWTLDLTAKLAAGSWNNPLRTETQQESFKEINCEISYLPLKPGNNQQFCSWSTFPWTSAACLVLMRHTDWGEAFLTNRTLTSPWKSQDAESQCGFLAARRKIRSAKGLEVKLYGRAHPGYAHPKGVKAATEAIMNGQNCHVGIY